MKVYRKENGKVIELHGNAIIADSIIELHGYKRLHPSDIENYNDNKWEGIEFNRLFVKDGILYRFNEWNGLYPYKSLNIQEIGKTSM